ncbi:MAG TPA: molybdopterin-synthase adenylyltransferase MoeB [Xanthomonadaceae bacterium]|nr:molybdopterin-synthase adenylyltransferase MoeB [Xanthomonadaceae bacterium]
MSSRTPAPPEAIAPRRAHALQCDGAVLVDVREPAERALGAPETGLVLPLADIEAGRVQALPRGALILTLCARGQRSQRAASRLRELGFEDAASIQGGFAAWREAGLPEAARGDDDFAERYLRHLLLPEIGEHGQRRLAAARVVLVGAGGLGSPVGLYLAAAGVGRVRVVDNDRVERSNLQRQVLHTEARVGMAKVESAARALKALNPGIVVETVDARLDSTNVEAVLEGAEVVVDGADNFPTRYLLSDACVRLRVPMVYGAVYRFEGQAAVFDAGRHRGEAPCYRCLFPDPPPAEAAPDCATVGVLGVLPGLVGMVQATETLKLLLGLGEPLIGRLLHVDALGMRFRETRLRPDPDCPVCAPGREFPGYIDYERFCAA